MAWNKRMGAGLTGVVMAAVASVACSDGSTSSSSSSGGSTSSSSSGGALCTTPTVVTCGDALIQDLNLKTDVNPGAVTSTQAGSVFTTEVDATAGGAFNPNPPSFIYARFTDTGLEKVEVSDEAALDSMGWDIAFRRYVVRVNSADSGPSCVRAMRMPATATFDSVTMADASLPWKTDDIMTTDCTLIPDGSGLESSPLGALASYYSYPGCVKMTNHVFVIQLANGRHVKLTIDRYYFANVQLECDTTDAATSTPTGSGHFGLRWAFLD
jgi:hypothetical protein